MRIPISRAVAGLLAASAVVLLGSVPVSAHIEPDVESVQAGQEVTVGFVVGHGCDGQPTTRIEIRVPDEVTSFKAGDLAGWTSALDGQVVTFDGNLPDDTELGFPVRFTAPSAATTLRFPIVQTCGDVEVSWLSEDHDAEHPAPVVRVEGTAPATTGPVTTAPVTTAPVVESTTVQADTAPATTTTPVVATPTDSDEDDGGGSGSTVWVIVGGVAILAVIVGGIAVARSRKGGADPTL